MSVILEKTYNANIFVVSEIWTGENVDLLIVSNFWNQAKKKMMTVGMLAKAKKQKTSEVESNNINIFDQEVWMKERMNIKVDLEEFWTCFAEGLVLQARMLSYQLGTCFFFQGRQFERYFTWPIYQRIFQ